MTNARSHLLLLASLLIASPVAAQQEVGQPINHPGQGVDGGGGKQPGSPDQVNIGPIMKATRDHHPEYDGSRPCAVTREKAELIFTADGILACQLSSVPEGALISVTLLSDRDVLKKYSITIAFGHSSDATVRGLSTPSCAAAGANAPPSLDTRTAHFGPIHADSATISIQLSDGTVSQKTPISIDRIYMFNLGVVVAADLSSYDTYSVINGQIAATPSTWSLNYYLGLTWYPFSWLPVASGSQSGAHYSNGRYYKLGYESESVGDFLAHHFGLEGAASLTAPSHSFYLGASLEVVPGLSLTGGWQPIQRQTLASGSTVGETISGSAVPLSSAWRWNTWVFGISVDAALAKAVTGALK